MRGLCSLVVHRGAVEVAVAFLCLSVLLLFVSLRGLFSIS